MDKQHTKQKRPLVIDCQVFQTASWHRGMGKYSLAFLGGLFQQKELLEDYKLYFLFNANLEKRTEVTGFISEHYAGATYLDIDLRVPKEPRTENSVAPVIAVNKDLLAVAMDKKFGSSSYAFLILALYLDEVCPVFPDEAADKLMIYYDSIPYLYHQRYGQFAGFFSNFYMPHTATVYEATKVLTISKTVANDLHLVFGIPENCIYNIDGASIPRGDHKPEKPDIGIAAGGFILMPTGQELRKNNTRAVRAFEKFRALNKDNVKLVVTSYFTDEARKELQSYSNHVIFSGNVSEGEMNWLYQKCRFVLFPSEYEGLGLPILEAVEQQKPIACSDISVFREISKIAFHFFDPLNIDAIADTLQVTDEKAKAGELDTKAYKSILSHYSWGRTADAAVAALRATNEIMGVHKKKVAIFCPDPEGFSAIGKVVTESHAWYSRYFDITYYFDRGPNHDEIRPSPLSALAPCFDVDTFSAEDYATFDAVIYHIGNSEYHLNIIHTALAFPGYVILHDTYLSGAYANLIEEGYITNQRLELEKTLDRLLPDLDNEEKPRSSSLTSVVNSQIGVVVHSKYAQNAVKRKLIKNGVVVKQLNLPVDAPIFEDITHASSGRLNVSFAGIIAKIKGTDIIESIAKSPEFLSCNINIFGYAAVEPERLEELKALSHVRLVTNPSDHDFQNLMASTDILINVRMAYRGETSLTTLEAMRYGAAVLVRNFGWYAELPDDAVVKVNEPAESLVALRQLMKDSKTLASVKAEAIAHIRADFSHQAYAAGMYKLIDETALTKQD